MSKTTLRIMALVGFAAILAGQAAAAPGPVSGTPRTRPGSKT